jgi:hypothetical protein
MGRGFPFPLKLGDNMKLFLSFMVFCISLSFPLLVSAHGNQYDTGKYYGTTTTTTDYMYADSTYGDDTWIDVYINGMSSDASVLWYENVGGISTLKSTSNVTSFPATVTAPTGVISFRLQSNDGKEVFASYAHSTNPNSEHITWISGNTPSVGTDPTPEPSYTDATNRDIVNAVDGLKQVNDSIKSVLDSNGVKLDTIIDQITPTVTINSPPVISNPKLEDNQPTQPTTTFTDNTTYFADQGDAAVPGKLPTAPEPDPCWENGTVCRENPLIPELEQSSDPVGTPDLVGIAEPEKTSDLEMVTDNEMVSDLPLMKNPERVSDVPLIKSPTATVDPVRTMENVFAKDPVKVTDSERTQTGFYSPHLPMVADPVSSANPDWTSN